MPSTSRNLPASRSCSAHPSSRTPSQPWPRRSRRAPRRSMCHSSPHRQRWPTLPFSSLQRPLRPPLRQPWTCRLPRRAWHPPPTRRQSPTRLRSSLRQPRRLSHSWRRERPTQPYRRQTRRLPCARCLRENRRQAAGQRRRNLAASRASACRRRARKELLRRSRHPPPRRRTLHRDPPPGRRQAPARSRRSRAGYARPCRPRCATRRRRG